MAIIIFSSESFSHQPELIVCYWSLNDKKSPQISRTFLSILAVLHNAVVWIVSTCSQISKSSSSRTNPLKTLTSAPITIGITVIFTFNIFQFSVLVTFFTCHLSFSFTLRSAETAKSKNRQLLIFWLTITRCVYLAEIRWSVCISKSQ